MTGQPWPTREYGAICADPPWTFENFSEAGEGRNPSAHYATISLAAIKALPVGDLAARDCALFLWVTDPMLPEGLEVLRAWGFAYKTVGFNWAKLNPNAPETGWGERDFCLNTGYWTRANPELCLLGTRGRPERRATDVRRLLIAKRREHSRKPDEARRRIERLVGGPYLELFARESAPGWDSWGDQAGLLDGDGVETRLRPSAPAPRQSAMF